MNMDPSPNTAPKRSKAPIIVIAVALSIVIVLIIILVIMFATGNASAPSMPSMPSTPSTPSAPTYTQTLTNAQIQQVAQQPVQTVSAPASPVQTSTSVTYNDPSYTTITPPSTTVAPVPRGYERYNFLTYEGGDLLYRADLAGKIGDLAALCTARGSECIGFISTGQLKYKAPDKSMWFVFSDKPGDGLYLKN
jgi:hypothetical protein